jgi:hypothetical protein
LIAAGASVKVLPISHNADQMALRIDAAFKQIRLSESLALVRTSGAWIIADARLQ